MDEGAGTRTYRDLIFRFAPPPFLLEMAEYKAESEEYVKKE
ncbi:hypothetical protein STRDD11_02254 [Streptococcus sp. DD11]|nr:hypothetical protein STRDD11_02254 [Streptococcus sp. DD11]